MSSLHITLAGKHYEVRQLTIAQLRDLSVGVVLPDVPDPQEAVRRSFDRAVGTIAVAVRENYPELTVDALYQMQITRDEMRDANDAVLRFSGLLPERRTSTELRAEITALERELRARETEESASGESVAGAP